MTTQLLQRMTEAETQKAADAVRRLWKLARDAAGGADLDPGKVLDELKAIGKTRAEFEDLVGNLTRRAQLAAEYARLPALEQEQAEASGRLTELNEAFARAREEHAAAAAPLRHRLTRLKEQIRDTTALRRELVDSCRDPETLDRLGRARLAVAGAVARLDEARARVDRQRGRADDLEGKAAKATTRELEAEYLADAGREHAKFHQYRADVDAAVAALAAAEAALKQAEDLTLRA